MKRVRWYAVTALGLFLLIMMLVPAGPDAQTVRITSNTVLSTGHTGTRALFLLLPQLGMHTEILRRPNYAEQANDITLWILGGAALGRRDQQDIATFLQRGGKVVTLAEHAALLLSTPEQVPLLKEHPKAGLRTLGAPELTLMQDPCAFETGPEPTWVLAVAQNDRPVVAGWRVGAGTLVSLGTPDIVQNQRIGVGDNGLFVARLAMRLGGRHVFDEVKTGFGEADLASLLTRVPYRWGIAQGALAMLAGVCALATRRFPARTPPAPRRRRTLDHIRAVAGLWQEARDAGLPLRAILRATAERARGIAVPSEERDPFIARVVRVRPDLADAARSCLQRAEHLAAVARPNPEAARAVTAELLRIEQKVTPW